MDHADNGHGIGAQSKKPMIIRVAPAMPTRPCRFILSLQEDSVFADFDICDEGHVFLRRISFDGYGCCSGDCRKMSLRESSDLHNAVSTNALNDPSIGALLRRYFRNNSDLIWSDALASRDLV